MQGATGANSPKALAPTAGTSVIAAAVAAASLDWIWVPDSSPASFGWSSTDEAHVSVFRSHLSDRPDSLHVSSIDIRRKTQCGCVRMLQSEEQSGHPPKTKER